MEVRLITTESGFQALEAAWSALWKRCRTPNVFLHYQWVAAFIRAFQHRSNLYILAAFDANELVAVLPLFRSRSGLLQMLGYPRSDYTDILSEERHAPKAVENVFRFLEARDDWSRLSIEELPEDSILRRCLGTRRCGRLYLDWARGSPCLGIDMKQSGGVVKGLIRKKSLVRHDKGLQRLGHTSLKVIRDWSGIAPHLDGLFRQHVERWGTLADGSIYEDETEKAFCRLYSEGLANAGLLHFSILSSGDRVVAYHLGFECGGVFFWYKPTFEPDYARHSPGEVLIRRLLIHCHAAGIDYFDFTRGSEAYKERFANALWQNYRLTVCRRYHDRLRHRARRFTAIALEAVRRQLRAARRKIRRRPTAVGP